MGAPLDPQSPRAETDLEFIARAARWAIVAAIALGVVLALLWILKAALTPLAIAFALAYVLDPLIDRLEALRVPRRFAIVILIGTLGALLATAFLVVVPQLQADISALLVRLPDYLD